MARWRTYRKNCGLYRVNSRLPRRGGVRRRGKIDTQSERQPGARVYLAATGVKSPIPKPSTIHEPTPLHPDHPRRRHPGRHHAAPGPARPHQPARDRQRRPRRRTGDHRLRAALREIAQGRPARAKSGAAWCPSTRSGARARTRRRSSSPRCRDVGDKEIPAGAYTLFSTAQGRRQITTHHQQADRSMGRDLRRETGPRAH